MDDIIVWGDGDSLAEAQQIHDFHLESLMQKVTALNVHLNADKLKYRCQEMKFAGYILSLEGHRADPEKCAQYQKWNAQRTLGNCFGCLEWSTI